MTWWVWISGTVPAAIRADVYLQCQPIPYCRAPIPAPCAMPARSRNLLFGIVTIAVLYKITMW